MPPVYTKAVPQPSMVLATAVPVIPTLMSSRSMPPSIRVSSRSNKGQTSKMILSSTMTLLIPASNMDYNYKNTRSPTPRLSITINAMNYS